MNKNEKSTLDAARKLTDDISKLLHNRSISTVELITAFACVTCDMICQVEEGYSQPRDMENIKNLCELYTEMVVDYLGSETVAKIN